MSGRIISLPVPSWRIWAADQARFPAVTAAAKRTLCASNRAALRDSAQQCRVQHFLPLPASAGRQKLQDLDETEILILCYCIKFD